MVDRALTGHAWVKREHDREHPTGARIHRMGITLPPAGGRSDATVNDLAPGTERTLSRGDVALRWGAHPVHGVGARGRRSERTPGLEPVFSAPTPRPAALLSPHGWSAQARRQGGDRDGARDRDRRQQGAAGRL